MPPGEVKKALEEWKDEEGKPFTNWFFCHSCQCLTVNLPNKKPQGVDPYCFICIKKPERLYFRSGELHYY